MAEQAELMGALDARAARRDQRRDFFKALGATAAMGVTVALATKSGPANAQAALTDADILNFALNLEYLEAQFYYQAAFGQYLPDSILGGSGTRGQVTGGSQVPFTDPIVRQYAIEIANDERAHVEFLRTAIGTTAVAQPTIDISIAPTGAFSNAARSAGLIGAGESFNPYLNDNNFLLGAFIFEDVGVTAYKGAAPLLASPTFIEAAAGILAVEAYHASVVRTTLFGKGIALPRTPTAPITNPIDQTEAISNARDSLDGTPDRDQGVAPAGTGVTATSNIAPTDGDAIAFSRTAGQVLNIVYLNRLAVTGGGFFPNGVNGNAALRTSAAN